MNKTQKLFEQLKESIKLVLEDNEVTCPTCGGLQKIYEHTHDGDFISSCPKCYNGKLYVCEYCGGQSKTSMCNCKEASHVRWLKRQNEYAKREREYFKKAEKIQYKDYDGLFFINEDRVVPKDEFEEWLYENMLDDAEYSPKYFWATSKRQCFDLDLYEIVLRESEDDGYEDMIDYLDTDGKTFKQAQELLSKWVEEQGDSIYSYSENYKRAVIVKDLIKEIREEINK